MAKNIWVAVLIVRFDMLQGFHADDMWPPTTYRSAHTLTLWYSGIATSLHQNQRIPYILSSTDTSKTV